MRVVIQRVTEAKVTINNNTKSEIKNGLLILLGIEDRDNNDDINWLTNKIAGLRIFDDDKGIMNLSIKDINGEIIVVSQFTLHATTKKGNRPSYIRASKPDTAIPLYNSFIDNLGKHIGKEVKTGEFGAMMQLTFTNDGPVTIIIDSKERDF